jgi:phosphatidate cytidylyltransferase
MKQRAISAVIFVAAMLGGLFGGAITFYILFAIITGGGLWEFNGLIFSRENNHLRLRKFVGTVFGLLPFLVFGSKTFNLTVAGFSPYNFIGSLSGDLNPMVLSVVGLLLLVFSLLIVELFLKSEQPFGNIGHYLTGIVYVGLPFTLLISIADWQDHYAPFRVLGLLLLTWTNDTMQYVVGSQIGKTPFFARVSPKKTWEGTLGGMACTFLVAYFFSLWLTDFTLNEWMLMGGLVAVFGTTGDLIESLFKRSLQVKDSGSILPGHGGFLDRFDSFIFVLPWVWVVLEVWGRR